MTKGFVIRTYGRTELAQLYNPLICSRSALEKTGPVDRPLSRFAGGTCGIGFAARSPLLYSCYGADHC